MSGVRGGDGHRRERSAAALAAVLACVLVSSGCTIRQGAPAPGGSRSRSPGADSMKGGDVPIGVDLELSGSAAARGDAYKKALTLAAERINAEGALGVRRVRLVVRDNRSDPAESGRVAKDLIRADHVVGMVGAGTTPTTLSLAGTVEDAGVPTVSMGASRETVEPAASRRYLFTTSADAAQVVRVMLKDMRSRGFRRVGLVTAGDRYAGAGAAAFTAAAGTAGIEVVAHERLSDVGEDSASQGAKQVGKQVGKQVERIVTKRPDAIVCWSDPSGAALAAKSVLASGFAGRTYVDAGAGAQQFLKAAGMAGNGVLVVQPSVLVVGQASHLVPNYQRMRSFHAAYTRRYGSYSGFASYAADALGLLVAAIKKAGTTDPAKVRDALEHLHYVGITGVYAMGRNATAGSPRPPCACSACATADGWSRSRWSTAVSRSRARSRVPQGRGWHRVS